MTVFLTLTIFALAGIAMVLTEAFKPPVGSGGFMINSSRQQAFGAKRRRAARAERPLKYLLLAISALTLVKDLWPPV